MEAVSILELFTVGPGPSSSHTVGPMRAALRFGEKLVEAGYLEKTSRVQVHLYGSLALTGRGHGTDRAVLLGLTGERPEEVEVDRIPARVEEIRQRKRLLLLGRHEIAWEETKDLVFHAKRLPGHPNGLRFVAFSADGKELLSAVYYSTGGGFVEEKGRRSAPARPLLTALAFPFRTGSEMLEQAQRSGLAVSEMTLRNESIWRTEAETRRRLLEIWSIMEACIDRGCRTEGVLPGGLGVTRRASRIFARLSRHPEWNLRDPLTVLDWISLWALAVAEENAAGGRVVTAPTNGSAGVLPSVLSYLSRIRGASDDHVVRCLLTAGAVGLLYKFNASLSGAEVGCQGEIGAACSMASAALTEALGGTVPQVENAAEIGMEHNLGLTCDPVGGLVQIPCIERNAVAAVKAVEAARLALAGDGTHRVSLDRVIRTMRDTGMDMSRKYKETAQGGLALNVVEC